MRLTTAALLGVSSVALILWAVWRRDAPVDLVRVSSAGSPPIDDSVRQPGIRQIAPRQLRRPRNSAPEPAEPYAFKLNLLEDQLTDPQLAAAYERQQHYRDVAGPVLRECFPRIDAAGTIKVGIQYVRDPDDDFHWRTQESDWIFVAESTLGDAAEAQALECLTKALRDAHPEVTEAQADEPAMLNYVTWKLPLVAGY